MKWTNEISNHFYKKQILLCDVIFDSFNDKESSEAHKMYIFTVVFTFKGLAQ